MNQRETALVVLVVFTAISIIGWSATAVGAFVEHSMLWYLLCSGSTLLVVAEIVSLMYLAKVLTCGCQKEEESVSCPGKNEPDITV